MKCVINSPMTNRHMVMGVVFAKVILTIALCLILITKKENIEEGVLLRILDNVFEMIYLLTSIEIVQNPLPRVGRGLRTIFFAFYEISIGCRALLINLSSAEFNSGVDPFKICS